eukprot:symbB.v1.2.024635.t1/scaffold2348.1/size84933/2
MEMAMVQVSVTLMVLTALTFNMFQGSQSPTWWGRYLVYPMTYILAHQVGSEHLMPACIIGTLVRYAINLLFTCLSKMDSFSERVKIHRVNPPAEQHERELDWDGPVILSPTAFVLVDAITPWLRSTVPLSFTSLAVCFLAHYLVVVGKEIPLFQENLGRSRPECLPAGGSEPAKDSGGLVKPWWIHIGSRIWPLRSNILQMV